MFSSKRQRVTVKLDCPNPLFEKWLTEWKDEAKQKESKMQFCFSTALKSLKKYPLPLKTGKECKILNGFGDKLCKMLDEKLEKHRCTVGEPEAATIIIPNIDELIQAKPRKKPTATKAASSDLQSLDTKSTKEYIPAYKSGPYAILMALYEITIRPDYQGFTSKKEIMKTGQSFCDTSFENPLPGSRYTAWSSMRTLISKRLVHKESNPAKFSLTDEGFLLACKLATTSNSFEEKDKNDPNLSSQVTCSSNLYSTIRSNAISEKYDICLNRNGTGASSSSTSTYTSTNNNNFSQPIQTRTDVNFDINSLEALTNLPLKLPRYNSDSSVPASSSSSSKSTSTSGLNKKKHKSTSEASSTVSTSTQSSDLSQLETIFLSPGDFDIILLVDTQEIAGSNKRTLDAIVTELTNLNVKLEVRNLKIGDYAWICRDRTSNSELILPYIIERKRMDDLGHSIKDGRFHEQKFRLKQCGLQNVIYLIESYGNNEHHLGLPITSLYQAATNTLIQDKFSVKFTDSLRGTVEYLSCLTRILNDCYKDKTLMSCPKENLSTISLDDDLIPLMFFKEFNKSSSKSKPIRVSDMFIRQLLQIKGMSVDKALAITGKYPTPKFLKLAYTEVSESDAEKMLSLIPYGKLNKKVGLVLSQTVYKLFTSQHY